MNTNGYHAELAGSAAHRWIRCPGSVRLIKQAGKRPSGEAAREGTFAHAVAAAMLGGKRVRANQRFAYEDHGEACQRAVDADVLEHVQTYVDYVLTLKLASSSAELHVEVRLDLKKLVREGMWGTADAIVDGKRVLHVVDLKFGRGTPVRVGTEAEPNEQLLYYAAGALDKFGWRHQRVVIHVVQPRCQEVEPTQALELDAAWVRWWAEEVLWAAAHATDAADAPLVVGDHCRFCDALAVCPAQAAEAQKLAMTDFDEPAVRQPQVPDRPVDIARVLRAAPVIDAWLRACEERAHELLERGDKLDGFKLVAKRSNRKWPEGMTEQKILTALKRAGLKVSNVVDDCFTDPELLSPAQMEKLPGGKEAVAIVAVKPDAGTTVALESDRREAVDPAGDFGDLL